MCPAQLQGPTCKLGGDGETHGPTRLVAISTEAQAAPAAGAGTLQNEKLFGLCQASKAFSRPAPTLGYLGGNS